MSTPRIHQSASFRVGETHWIENQAAQHLLRVLRCRIDDPVILFNGDGRDYASRITLIEKNRLAGDSSTGLSSFRVLPSRMTPPRMTGRSIDRSARGSP